MGYNRKLYDSLLFPVLKRLLGPLLRWRWNMRAVGVHILRRLKPPYLVVANHVGFWDPPMLGTYLPHAPHFIATDDLFRTTVGRLFYQLVGAIPKTKGIPDLMSMIRVRRLVDSGGVVALFPEGRRSWDGRALPLHPRTGAFVRALRCPVVSVRFRGGYLTRPRWARFGRRGLLTVEFALAVDEQEARRASANELQRRVADAIKVDEWGEQRRELVAFHGRRRAEYVETLYVVCSCGAAGSIVSRGNRYECTECGMAGRVDEYGFLHGGMTFAELMDDQEPRVRAWIERMSRAREDTVLLCASHATVSGAYGAHVFHRTWAGPVRLYRDRIEADGLSLALASIEGCDMQAGHGIEFSVGRRRYRLNQPARPHHRRAPLYLWMRYIQRHAATQQSDP